MRICPEIISKLGTSMSIHDAKRINDQSHDCKHSKQSIKMEKTQQTPMKSKVEE